ncbi:receptor-like protein kinase [Gossypium australe]|uniref:Receptor-like protein kinase n=1 Tax=Gossypium australe TaxID=47621 RepID=A0A5B6VBM0_9ROSI|nr:receptor-like protein kinase [Gossypium australe]
MRSLKRIRLVAYRSELLSELDRIHKCYLSVYATMLHVTHSEGPIEILACEVKEVRNKKVALVKILWQ